ncbi:MAG: diguanylate cyclase [Gaiellaceae bacterium]
MNISRHTRSSLLLLLSVVVIAVMVWRMADWQQSAALRGGEQTEAAERMRTAMLSQENGLRGFVYTNREELLEPYVSGRREFDLALSSARADARGNVLAGLRRAIQLSRSWQASAEDAIRRVRLGGRSAVTMAEVDRRRALTDSYRAAHDHYVSLLERKRDRDLARTGVVSAALIFTLTALFGLLGYLLMLRAWRDEGRLRSREREYRETQRELSESLQVTRSEPEAHVLLKRHLERTIPGSSVVVLNRNTTDNRLVPTTALDPDSELAGRLEDAEPQSCLAIRLGRTHERGGREPLMACDVCGGGESSSTCVPSLVGGEVIGSVLIRHESPSLEEADRERVSDSVATSAPMLANLRNLELAETRAETDALTGLPNSRALRDTLKRMVAQAGRTLLPLSVILLDLDHFKTINDTHGHERGDDVLAAVGSALAGGVRESDFAGRYGGEEFLVICPDTDREGALVLAEKLRLAVSAISVPGVDLPLSASLGVAALPADGVEPDSLVRLADRALYAAKAKGRNCVQAAGIQLAPDSGASA